MSSSSQFLADSFSWWLTFSFFGWCSLRLSLAALVLLELNQSWRNDNGFEDICCIPFTVSKLKFCDLSSDIISSRTVFVFTVWVVRYCTRRMSTSLSLSKIVNATSCLDIIASCFRIGPEHTWCGVNSSWQIERYLGCCSCFLCIFPFSRGRTGVLGYTFLAIAGGCLEGFTTGVYCGFSSSPLPGDYCCESMTITQRRCMGLFLHELQSWFVFFFSNGQASAYIAHQLCGLHNFHSVLDTCWEWRSFARNAIQMTPPRFTLQTSYLLLSFNIITRPT
jgi:hypothetical protein